MVWAMVPLCFMALYGQHLIDEDRREMIQDDPLVRAARSAEDRRELPVDPQFVGTFSARVGESLGSALLLLSAALFGGGMATLGNRIMNRMRPGSSDRNHWESAAVGLLAGVCFIVIVLGGVLVAYG